jgi:hypothetical protein
MPKFPSSGPVLQATITKPILWANPIFQPAHQFDLIPCPPHIPVEIEVDCCENIGEIFAGKTETCLIHRVKPGKDHALDFHGKAGELEVGWTWF